MSRARKDWKNSAAYKELKKLRQAKRNALTKKFVEENTRTWFCEKNQMWMKSSPFYRDRLANDSEIKAALASERGDK